MSEALISSKMEAYLESLEFSFIDSLEFKGVELAAGGVHEILGPQQQEVVLPGHFDGFGGTYFRDHHKPSRSVTRAVRMTWG